MKAKMRYLLLSAFALLVCALLATSVPAQRKKRAPKTDKAKVLLALPFGIAPGKTTKVTLRGLKLDTAKGVRLETPIDKATIKLLKASKSGPPDKLEANKVGDTQVEAEIQLPADISGDSVSLIVTTATGDAPPHKLLIDKSPVVIEKEPNDGFAKAQAVNLGQTVQGKIDRAQDVDVYSFTATAGQKVVLEVFASRYGSALDSFLTLHDEDGQVISSNDDLGDSLDSRIETTLPKAGKYFVSVIDVHDSGGQLHCYRLTLVAK